MKRWLSVFCALVLLSGFYVGGPTKTAAAVALGDVNHDGNIDTSDARLILQYIVKKIDGTKLDAALADVNGDGAVDTTDVRLILQKIVGKIDAFPAPQPLDLTQYVNMNIGVGSGTNTVIGPQRPNASVNPSPDGPGYCANGYTGGSMPIRGFSQMHVSGTGVPKYGQVLLSPQVGLSTRLDGHDSGKANERPTCSEYSVTLTQWNIGCAFTCAENTSIYKFTYPESNEASLLIDMAHNNGENNNVGHNSGIYNSSSDINIRIGQDAAGDTTVSGGGYYMGGWGQPHYVYFYAVTDTKPAAVGTYDAAGPKPGETALGPATISSETQRMAGLGAYLTFDTANRQTVTVKVAMSFTSVEAAKAHMEAEIPAWDYDGVKAETEQLWNKELNRIVIDGTGLTTAQKTIFYTALYHSLLMPRYRTGDIPEYDDAVMLDDHFAGWDTFRTVMPLLTLIKPDTMADIVNSFITRYEQNGYVRDSMTGGHDMYEQQGGDNVDVIIADAYLKLKGTDCGVDWNKAYQIVKNDADNYRLSWQGSQNSFADNVIPSPGSDYKDLGYIPGDTAPAKTMCCNYTLDYAYNDFCAALMAKDLGTPEDYQKYLARSGNWQNLWNPNLSYGGYTGFIGPRAKNGDWINIDVTKDWGSWSDYFYEASSYNYSFYVPQDPQKLIELCGGPDAFCQRLLDGIDGGFVDFGNEPAFLSAFMFAYTDQPYLMTECVEKVRSGFSLNGNPGNDDSGALSSWYLFTTMGLFPCAGQDLYYLISPWVADSTINLENGKKIQIVANNLSAANKYIQSVTVNGAPYNKTTIRQEDIADGAVIVYQMGPKKIDYTQGLDPNSVGLVSFNTGNGSKLRDQFVQLGGALTPPADPTRDGFGFGGWYTDAACTAAWDFTADKVTGDMTLYARWDLTGDTGVISWGGLEKIANLSHNTLSDPGVEDWAFLGYTAPVRMSGGAGIFTGAVTSVSGGLNQEDMSQYNAGTSPYFSWTGGTPTAAATDVRSILWSAAGLQFTVDLPAGQHEVALYISGVRAGAILEVHAAAGAILDQPLWGFTGDTRPYDKALLEFNCPAAGTYTVRLMTDQGGQLDTNHSVSLFAATATDMG